VKKKKNYKKDLEKISVERDLLIKEIDLIKETLIKSYPNTEQIIKEINKEIKYINDLVEIILKQNSDEDKLNKALYLFIDEYSSRVNNINELIQEEIDKNKFQTGL
tara:strand:- start:61 stop:378 length:318 start_codon:yes stop_codon:yes gene_type:complete